MYNQTTNWHEHQKRSPSTLTLHAGNIEHIEHILLASDELYAIETAVDDVDFYLHLLRSNQIKWQ